LVFAKPPKADIAERRHHACFVPSKLMSGAAGAIAALTLGARYRPWKNKSEIGPAI